MKRWAGRLRFVANVALFAVAATSILLATEPGFTAYWTAAR